MRKNIWLTLLCLSGVVSNVKGALSENEFSDFLVNLSIDPVLRTSGDRNDWNKCSDDQKNQIRNIIPELDVSLASAQQNPVVQQQPPAPAAAVNVARQQLFVPAEQSNINSADARYEAAVKRVHSTSLEDLVKDPQFDTIQTGYAQDFRAFDSLTDNDIIVVGNKLQAAKAIRDKKGPDGLSSKAREMYNDYFAKNPVGRQNDDDDNDPQLQQAIELSKAEAAQAEKRRIIDDKNDPELQAALKASEASEKQAKKRKINEDENDAELQAAINASKKLKQDSLLKQLKNSSLSEEEQRDLRKALAESEEIYNRNETSIERKKEKALKKAIEKVKKEPGTEKVWKEVAYVMRSFFKKALAHDNDDDNFGDFVATIGERYKNRSNRANVQAESDLEKIELFFQGAQADFSAFDEENPEPFTIENKRQLLDMVKMTQKYVRSTGSSFLKNNFANLVKLINKKSIAKLLVENLNKKTTRQLDSLSKTLGLANSKDIQNAIQKSKSESSIFGLDQIKEILSIWIPGESNESLDICKNVIDGLEAEKPKLQTLVLNVIRASQPIYGAFGLAADKKEILGFLGQRIDDLAKVSTDAITNAKTKEENAKRQAEQEADLKELNPEEVRAKRQALAKRTAQGSGAVDAAPVVGKDIAIETEAPVKHLTLQEMIAKNKADKAASVNQNRDDAFDKEMAKKEVKNQQDIKRLKAGNADEDERPTVKNTILNKAVGVES